VRSDKKTIKCAAAIFHRFVKTNTNIDEMGGGMFQPLGTFPNHESNPITEDDERRLKREIQKINSKYRSRRYRLKEKWRKDGVVLCTDVLSKRQLVLLNIVIAQLNEKAACFSLFTKGSFQIVLTADHRSS
jgi:hypothetical protein